MFWAFLRRTEVIGDDVGNPFDAIVIPKTTGAEIERQAFAPEAPARLYNAAMTAGDGPLAALTAIAAFSGMRISEICALKVEDVRDGVFHIADGKTKSARRRVPVHSAIAGLVDRLIDEAKGGYLIPCPEDGPDRSNAIGARFSRMKTVLGYGPEYVFHSLRKSFLTALHSAGVDEAIAAPLAGHAIRTLSYGLYSGGPDIAVLRAAVEKVQYPGLEPR